MADIKHNDSDEAFLLGLLAASSHSPSQIQNTSSDSHTRGANALIDIMTATQVLVESPHPGFLPLSSTHSPLCNTDDLLELLNVFPSASLSLDLDSAQPPALESIPARYRGQHYNGEGSGWGGDRGKVDGRGEGDALEAALGVRGLPCRSFRTASVDQQLGSPLQHGHQVGIMAGYSRVTNSILPSPQAINPRSLFPPPKYAPSLSRSTLKISATTGQVSDESPNSPPGLALDSAASTSGTSASSTSNSMIKPKKKQKKTVPRPFTKLGNGFACQGCRRRKQKCFGSPICRACYIKNVPCIRSATPAPSTARTGNTRSSQSTPDDLCSVPMARNSTYAPSVLMTAPVPATRTVFKSIQEEFEAALRSI